MAGSLVAPIPQKLDLGMNRDLASYFHVENTFLKFKIDAPAPRHRAHSAPHQRAHSDFEVERFLMSHHLSDVTESDISDVSTHEPSTTGSDGPSRPDTPDPFTASDGPSRAHTPDPFEDASYGMHPFLQPRTLGSTDEATVPFRWKQAPLPDMQQAHLIVERLPKEAMQQRSSDLLELMAMRRSVRFFSSDDVPIDVVEACVATAGTSPSGVHKQPWFYAIVRSQDMKQRIREVVEEEEKSNYKNEKRMRTAWKTEATSILADTRLASGNGTPVKAYLTEAPVLIVAFKQTYGVGADGTREDNYWVGESVGMSVGFLQMALHNVGLATLPTRPAGAEHKITQLLGRPENEKLFLVLPVGYPSQDATIPYREVARKPLADICAVY
jgi:iodotyrosine deiodinase